MACSVNCNRQRNAACIVAWSASLHDAYNLKAVYADKNTNGDWAVLPHTWSGWHIVSIYGFGI